MPPIDAAALVDEAEDLGARLASLIGGLEADRLTPATAVRLLAAFAQAGKHAAAGEALVARRVDACQAHVAAGYRSTEQMVAARSGTGHAHAVKVVETGRRLGLERQADRQYRAAPNESRREPHARHLADALVTLCTRRSGDDVASRDTRAEVVFHVDLAAAVRGTVEDGERCMVRGGGPVPVERVRDAVGQGAFVKAVLRGGTDIRTVKHFGRRRPAELTTALEADPTTVRRPAATGKPPAPDPTHPDSGRGPGPHGPPSLRARFLAEPHRE